MKNKTLHKRYFRKGLAYKNFKDKITEGLNDPELGNKHSKSMNLQREYE